LGARALSHIPSCTLHAAEDAENGLRLAMEIGPDLILTDINLPGMDGIAASKWLKQNSATAEIPIIAVTGAAMKHDTERASDAGFFAYLTKPFRIKDAIDTVNAALHRSDSFAAQ